MIPRNNLKSDISNSFKKLSGRIKCDFPKPLQRGMARVKPALFCDCKMKTRVHVLSIVEVSTKDDAH